MIPYSHETEQTARLDYQPAQTISARVKKFLTNPGLAPGYALHRAKKLRRRIRATILRAEHPDGTLTRDVQGSLLRLDLSDPGIATDLALDGIREPLITKAYLRHLQSLNTENDGILVADIGANIGYYAFMPLAHTEIANVLAIEVDKENHEQLEANAELNGYTDRLITVCTAVGDTETTATLNRSEQSNRHTIAETTKTHYSKGTQNVKVKALPTICRENDIDPTDIDVIRMDVEGYETNVIRGIPDKIFTDGLLLNIEVHPNRLSEDDRNYLAERLTELGAEIKLATWRGIEIDVSSWEEVMEYTWLTILARVS